MTRDEILAAVAEVARAHVGFEGELGEPLRLVEDLGLDSIRLLVLAAEVENRFQVALTPADDAAIRTVGDLVTTVARRLADGADERRD
jgi:acyl carrier protein